MRPAPRRHASRVRGRSSADLTPRETTIVHLIGAGRSTTEIAKLLELHPRTIENHKRHIYEKLGVGSQSHAVARALSLGLFEPTLQVNPTEAGRPTLVIVHGPAGECRDQVFCGLLAHQLPVVLIRTRRALAHDHWVRWHRGPIVAVLVEPGPDDWSIATELGARAVAVRASACDRAAIIDDLARGACGLVFQDDIATGLCPMLDVICDGHFAMSGVYAAALAKEPPLNNVHSAPRLTGREQDILDSIACGHTIRQTARSLGIAPKTVENTQARLFQKLGARNRAESLTIADAWGLIHRAADHETPDAISGRPAIRRPP